MARRGNIDQLWSDNGTNFVGANNEFKRLLQEMDQTTIESKLRRQGITWHFNPPAATNMGGVWERAIRSTRKILAGLLSEHGFCLNADEFHTLLCEVEAILNSRPITSVSGDSADPEPLTPNHILTRRSSTIVPPPGSFSVSMCISRDDGDVCNNLRACSGLVGRKNILCCNNADQNGPLPVLTCK